MAEIFTEGSNSVHLSGQKNCVNRIVDDISQLYDLLPKKKLRRVDHLSRMALLAAGKALKDTDPGLINKNDIGVIMATGFGALQTTFDFLDSYIEKGDKLASPTHFSNSVHNAAAAHISICYGITGPNLTVSQFDMSFISALMTAQTWLALGKTKAVLVGVSDAFCDVLGYCIKKFLSSDNMHRYSFGEGAAFYVLTDNDETCKHGFFDQISLGNYQNEGLNISEDIPIVFSPSSIETCNDDFMQYLGKKGGIFYRNQLFSPTDCGTNIFYSIGVKQKICYVKIGQYGEYGKILINPIVK
jgi:3-oxoacyl-[acyl-carrier-protein] synthase II